MEFQTKISNAEIGAPQTQAHKRAGVAYRGINPLLYPGWDSLVDAHPGSSFFHRAAWARVLHETYGHLPVYFCRFVDGELEELFPIMKFRVRGQDAVGSRFPSPIFASRFRP